MRTLLSLFDFTGTWNLPFWDAGWNVVQIDLQHGHDVNDFDCEHLMDILDGQTVDGVIMAPPCTDFTTSGALWWNAKDADGRTAASEELIRQSIRTIEFLKPDFWALENPVGRLPRLFPELGKPIYFNPSDFAGWLDEQPGDAELIDQLATINAMEEWEHVTPAMIEVSKRRNLYTKKTCLYGHFPELEQRREQPLNVCKAGSWLMRLGGKSDATKNARSAAPEGFARAFFEAVKDYRLDWDAIEEGTAEYHSFQES